MSGETEDLAIRIEDDGEDEEMMMKDPIVNKRNQFEEDQEKLFLMSAHKELLRIISNDGKNSLSVS